MLARDPPICHFGQVFGWLWAGRAPSKSLKSYPKILVHCLEGWSYYGTITPSHFSMIISLSGWEWEPHLQGASIRFKPWMMYLSRNINETFAPQSMISKSGLGLDLALSPICNGSVFFKRADLDLTWCKAIWTWLCLWLENFWACTSVTLGSEALRNTMVWAKLLCDSAKPSTVCVIKSDTYHRLHKKWYNSTGSAMRAQTDGWKYRTIFEPTCAHARWALMHHFPSVTGPKVRLEINS